MPSSKTISIALVLFFALLLAVGVHTYRDYGIAFDERVQYDYGKVVWNRILAINNDLIAFKDRFYGPAYEILLVALEKPLPLGDSMSIYRFRHLCNFLTFFIGVCFFYLLANHRFNNRWLALLGCGMLCLSPRIYAHAFYNSKDIPFMVFFIIAIYTLVRFLERPTLCRSLLHAFICACLIDIRVLGIMAPALTFPFILCKTWKPAAGERTGIVVNTLIFTGTCAAITVLFWPTLWSNPWGNLLSAVQQMSRYQWMGSVLYGGETISAGRLPFHYTLVWIMISTPVAYLILWITGTVFSLRDVFVSPLKWSQNRRFDAIALLWMAIPLVSVVVLRSVLYDAWRHTYFIYPAILLLALKAFHIAFEWRPRRLGRLISSGFWRGLLVAMLAANMVGALWFMIRSHPHQDVYFNKLIGGIGGARFKYEMDYWGLSYKMGLEFVLRNDASEIIPVYVAEDSGRNNALILPPSERRRLLFVDRPAEAKYFLGAYRAATKPYPYLHRIGGVNIDGVDVLSIFKVPGYRESVQPFEAYIQAKNQLLTKGKSRAELDEYLDKLLREYLSAYVQKADFVEIKRGESLLSELQMGILQELRVTISNAVIGDPKHPENRIPMKTADISAAGLLMDLTSLQEGKFGRFRASELQLNLLELDGEAINRQLAQSTQRTGQFRVEFQEGKVSLRCLSRPQALLTAKIWVQPDAFSPESDNLWFKLDQVRLYGVPLPTGFVQWLLSKNNPLIKTSKIRGRLKLGALIVDGRQLKMGVLAR
jgi:hypothetical protein